MKKALGVISLILAALAAAPVQAQDFEGAKTAKAVWDITAGNEQVFIDRMHLIKTTAEGLKNRGIQPDFVLAIHGPATKFTAKTLAGTKFEKERLSGLERAQSVLQSLQGEGAKIEVCAIALDRGRIAKDNVQPFAVIEGNVLENLIVLQNKGYAYMPVDK